MNKDLIIKNMKQEARQDAKEIARLGREIGKLANDSRELSFAKADINKLEAQLRDYGIKPMTE